MLLSREHLLVDFFIFQDSRAKVKFLQFHSSLLLKSRNAFKVKDYLLPYLNQISSLIIEIYSNVISCLDRTSIFSQGNSSSKFNFCVFFKFVKKLISKNIKCRETTYSTNSLSNLLTRIFASSPPSSHAFHASFIVPKSNCFFTLPLIFCALESRFSFGRRNLSSTTSN